MKRFVLGVCIVLTACGASWALDVADVKTEKREYVIFPAEYTLPLPLTGYTRSTLTEAQAKRADAILWDHLNYEARSIVELDIHNWNAKKVADYKGSWMGQFFGLKDQDGHTVVLALYFSPSGDQSTAGNAWRTRIMESKECGPAYFIAKIDLVDQRVKDLDFTTK